MLKRLRTYLSRMFEPYLYTPEGFRLANRPYIVPADSAHFSYSQRRVITICNLFSNQKLSIDTIVRLLDTDRRTVISGLLYEGLILDRRQATGKYQFERRHTAKYHLPALLQSGESDNLRALCGEFGAETVSEFIFKEVLKKDERCPECRKRLETRSSRRQ